MNAQHSTQLGRLLLFGLTALLTLVFAAPSLAAPPEFQTVPLDATFIDENVTNQCGFPVQVHLLGTLNISIHDLQNGAVLELDHLHQATFTFTNLSTGTSYTSLSTRQNQFVIRPDGAAKVTASGIIAIITLPREGLLLKDVGHLVIDLNTGEITFQAGSHPLATGGNVQGLCTALR